ncbi:MAG: hypothetical protein E6J91_52965 [Deltaproteobacteria bacterium]|nr:MAG: hypothetical protein E6J91_52965 [Deltaproteobacteria bacterium]
MVIGRLREQLRMLSGDVSLEIVEIQEGSVRLTLSLSLEAVARLIERCNSGELQSTIGFDVSSIEDIEDDETGELSGGELGADVEARCSKCGDVWHVVVAKVGDQIVKVQCKQCGGYHRYKSPHGAPAEKKLPAASRPPREPRPPVKRFERPAIATDLSKPSRPYRANEQFEIGERIDHPSFGQGVVEISEYGKITVFFASGRRVLVQAKAAAGTGLARPKSLDHDHPPAGGKPVSEN